ncbi:MAG: hypothetical protein JW937_02370, partial [Candidatus Omnitrophica bacterium]|nr:hypothetical protein [Candidatus Omnitrophota bacterium]
MSTLPKLSFLSALIALISLSLFGCASSDVSVRGNFYINQPAKVAILPFSGEYSDVAGQILEDQLNERQLFEVASLHEFETRESAHPEWTTWVRRVGWRQPT